MIRLKLSPFFRDLAGTAATSFATIVCLIFSMQLLANGLGQDAFGAYSLTRRIISFSEPILTFGLGLALTRYVALSSSNNDRLEYLAISLLVVVSGGIFVLVTGCFFTDTMANMIFRDARMYGWLWVATLFLAISYSLFVVLYAFLRGSDKMLSANWWQLMTVAIGPLVIAWQLAEKQKVELIVWLNAALFFLAAIPLIWALRKLRRSGKTYRNKISDLFSYGLPRIPSQFAFGALLAIASFLAPYSGSLSAAGYLAISISLLKIVEGLTEAFGRAAFPRLTRQYVEGGKKAIGGQISSLVTFLLHSGVYATIHLFIWADALIVGWLGQEYTPAVPVTRIITIALLPYLVFVTLRVVLDSIDTKAIATKYLYWALTAAIISSIVSMQLDKGYLGLALSTSLGLWVLGAMTANYVIKTFSISLKQFHLFGVFIANVLCAIPAYYAVDFLSKIYTPLRVIISGFPVEILLLVGYILFLKYLRVNWVYSLIDRLFSRLPEKANY